MRLLESLSGLRVDAYLVGTAARTVLLGKRLPELFEIAANTPPEDLEGLAREAGCENVQKRGEGVTATHSGRRVYLTPFLSGKERRSWGAEAIPKPGGSIKEHLLSHHLKLEGVAVSAKGKLIDEMGAQADVERRIISTIEDPEAVFPEFPFAMLRAAGLISELGFAPAQNLLTAAVHHSHNITTVPPNVWREELEKLLLGDFPGEGLDFLAETRLCNFVLPELTNLIGFEATIEYHHKDLWEHTKLAVSRGKKKPGTRWALLLHDLGKVYTRTVEDGDVKFHKHEQVSRLLASGILHRLRFTKELRSRVLFLVSNHMKPGQYDEGWTDSAVRRLMRSAEDMLDDLIGMSQADISSKNPGRVRRNIRSLESLVERIKQIREEEANRIVLPKGLGNAIMQEFGLEPSARVGELMGEVKAAIEGGRVERNRSVEEYIGYLLKLHGSRAGANAGKEEV